MYYIGVDIGSTCAKTTVTDAGGEICFQEVCPTGWSSVDTAENIRKQLADAGFDPKDNVVVATGYGRVAIPYSDKTVTEITCHCAGAVQLFGHQEMGVIDIGDVHVRGGRVPNRGRQHTGRRNPVHSRHVLRLRCGISPKGRGDLGETRDGGRQCELGRAENMRGEPIEDGQ